MPDFLRATTEEARRRVQKRPLQPGVRVEFREAADGLIQTFGSVHRNADAWEDHIRDAFGTSSRSTYIVFLSHLAGLCGKIWDPALRENVPSELELNAALAIVHGIRPRSEVEATLAAQIVSLHFAQMKIGARIAESHWIDPRNATALASLSRATAALYDALNRGRRKTVKQHIKVTYERHDHKHVHIEEGGARNRTRARAPTRAREVTEGRPVEPLAALQGPDEARDGL